MSHNESYASEFMRLPIKERLARGVVALHEGEPIFGTPMSGWVTSKRTVNRLKNRHVKVHDSGRVDGFAINGQHHDFDNPKYTAFLKELTQVVQEAFPQKLDDNGFWTTCGSNDFDLALSATGRGMVPAAIPEVNRRKSAIAHLLREELTPNEQRAASLVVDVLFEHVQLKDIPEKNGSTSGFPYFTTDRETKVMMGMNALNNEAEILRLTQEGKHDELLRKYGIIFAALVGTRFQNERPGKIRPSANPLSLLVPDATKQDIHKYFPYPDVCSKDIGIEGFCAQRVRRITAPNQPGNALARKLLLPYQNGFKLVYAMGNSVKGKADLETKLNYAMVELKGRGVLVNCDPKQFDQTAVSAALSDIFYKKFASLESKAASDFVRYIAHSAMYIPFTDDVSEEEYPPFWCGHPYTPEYNSSVITMLQSGSAPTSFISHFVMWTMLCASLMDGGVDVDIETVRGLMSWNYKICNQVGLYAINGGDALLMLTTRDTRNLLREHFFYKESKNEKSEGEALAATSKKHVLIEEADNADFFGYVIRRDERNVIRCTHNLKSFHCKVFAPEYNVYDKRRSDFGISIKARYGIYSDNPDFAKYIALVDEIHQKYFGTTYTAWTRLQSESVGSTDVDMLFLDDPARIYYAIDSDDVSPALLEAEFSHYPLKDLHYRKELTVSSVDPAVQKKDYKDRIMHMQSDLAVHQIFIY